MSETQLLTMALSLVACFFGLLIMILGWLGNKAYAKLDEISKSLIDMAGELHTRINDVSGDMHEKISGHDRRIAVIENRCNDRHLHRQD